MKTVAPVDAVLRADWFLDGILVNGQTVAGATGPEYRIDLTPEQLAAGVHNLRFVVQDQTPPVHWPSSAQSHAQSHAPFTQDWTITVTRGGLPDLPFLNRVTTSE